jgi:hypothetical protein
MDKAVLCCFGKKAGWKAEAAVAKRQIVARPRRIILIALLDKK